MREKTQNSSKWSQTAIALMNGGGIREFSTTPWHNLTVEELYLMFPFGNTIEMIEISGKILLQALEYSVEDFNLEDARGKFLQVILLKSNVNIELRIIMWKMPAEKFY